jgi:hypothetical protein
MPGFVSWLNWYHFSGQTCYGIDTLIIPAPALLSTIFSFGMPTSLGKILCTIHVNLVARCQLVVVEKVSKSWLDDESVKDSHRSRVAFWARLDIMSAIAI